MGLIWQKMLVADASTGIEFVGGSTVGKNGATTGDSTLALNSGLTGGIASAVSNDDLVIAVFATGSTVDRTLAITDGTNNYTLIGSEQYSNDNVDVNLRIAYKFVSGDTATTFGPTGSSNDAGAMAVYVFRGVDSVTPLDVAATQATGINGNAANPPTITPTTPGAFIVCVGAGSSPDPVANYTTGSLVDFFSQNHDDTNLVVMGIGHKDDWVSGAFDCPAFTSDSTSAGVAWAATTIALRPA